jgi:hypothetical protein
MIAAIIGISAFGWIAERQGPETGLLGIGMVLLVTGLVAERMTRVSATHQGNCS